MTHTARHRRHGDATAPTSPDDLDASTPPWDIGRPQPAFRALADDGVIRGTVLDVRCGTGEHVLMCASPGLDATGVDLAATALATAEGKAHDREPHRVSSEEVRAAFTDGWHIDSIEPATLDVTVVPAGIRAWLVTATRTDEGSEEC